MTYADKLKDSRWLAVRAQVIARDGGRCRDCNKKSKHLEVHHCWYKSGDPWDTPERFLVTVCPDCHNERESERMRAGAALGYILAHQKQEFRNWFVKKLAEIAGQPTRFNLEIEIGPEQEVHTGSGRLNP
jgi:hypothetical protein